MVNYPCAIIFISGSISSFFIAKNQSLFPAWIIIVCSILIAFASAWLWWSILIVKWKIWAFNTVRNVHELKEKAIKENLIYEDNSYFNRFEIYTKKEALQWAKLQQKFELQDEIIDANNLPESTKLELSFFKIIVVYVISTSITLMGLFWFKMSTDILTEIISYPIIALGLYLFYSNFKEYKYNKIQLILSNQGIEIPNEKKYSWEDIYGEKIINVGIGSNSIYYIQFSTPDKAYKIKVYPIDCSKDEIENMLKIYRLRFKQQQVKHF
jgi:hypothetical protein